MAKKLTKTKKVSKSVKQTKRPALKARPKSVKATKPKTPKFQSPVARAAGNPFRAGSSYAVCYDLLASKPEGLTRQELVESLSNATKKDSKHSSYDCAVLLSAKQDGSRHQSCRPGFWIERINNHCKLHVTA